MLWCAVLCCGVLRCGVLCCGVLWCAVLSCAVVCCGVVCCGVLCCGVLWCAVVYCTVPYCTVPYRTVLYCTVLLFYFYLFALCLHFSDICVIIYSLFYKVSYAQFKIKNILLFYSCSSDEKGLPKKSGFPFIIQNGSGIRKRCSKYVYCIHLIIVILIVFVDLSILSYLLFIV